MDGVVLAGGKSKRMGRPKPFVELGGRPLIVWVIEALRPACREVFIVADRREPFSDLGCRVVEDLVPDRGPMGGIYTALSYTGERRAFVAACDTPFLRPRLVRYLASHVEGYEVAVPGLPDGLHPLQAVYTKDCLPRLYKSLIAGRLSLIDFLGGARVRVVSGREIELLDRRGLSFLNINAPQDLEQAAALLYRKAAHCTRRL